MPASSRWRCCAGPTTWRCVASSRACVSGATGDVARHQVLVQRLQALDHRSVRGFLIGASALADPAAVDGMYRHYTGESAGDEGLVGAVDVGEAEGFLEHGNAVVAAE